MTIINKMQRKQNSKNTTGLLLSGQEGRVVKIRQKQHLEKSEGNYESRERYNNKRVPILRNWSTTLSNNKEKSSNLRTEKPSLEFEIGKLLVKVRSRNKTQGQQQNTS